MLVEGASPSTHIRSRFPLHPSLSAVDGASIEGEGEQFDTAFIPHDFVDGGARNRARFRNVRFQNRTELAGISRPRLARGRGRLPDARRLERGYGGGQALWRAMTR